MTDLANSQSNISRGCLQYDLHELKLKNNNFIKKIEFILNCICNGDELILNDQHNTIDDTEYILEAFRGVRFSAIKIDIQKNDELLQFIHKITHAPIYYTDIHTWSLFESED